MDLIETPDNPAPPGAIVAMIAGRDGLTIRAVRWRTREGWRLVVAAMSSARS